MKNKQIIDRKNIISLVDDYLCGRKTLNDLEKIASDLLILDDAPDFDENEEELIIRFLNYIEGLDLPWNDHVNRDDMKLFREIVAEIKSTELAIDLLYLLEYRVEIEKLLSAYLANKLTTDQVELMLKEWNYPRAVELFSKIFKENKDNKKKLQEIINSYSTGQIQQFIELLTDKKNMNKENYDKYLERKRHNT